MPSFANIAFTPAVQALQTKDGSREAYARMERDAGPFTGLGVREAEFIGKADSFYMATVSETGWPYVQHRGGPRGFVRVITPVQLAFADFRGNRQFVSAGNVTHDDRVALIFMDYARRQRLKLLGHLRFIDLADATAGLAAAVQLPDYRARAERAATIDLAAVDWNCPQHITPRFTLPEIESQVAPLRDRIAELEAELAAVRVAQPPA
jgi:predicted pyridoxine 5'-phosphate oxidase superfamily flavin-nucleotide-binding protein